MKEDPSYLEANEIKPHYSDAYDRAAQAFDVGWNGNPLVSRLHQSENGPVELGKMMQFGAQGFGSLAEIYTLKAQLEKLKKEYEGLPENDPQRKQLRVLIKIVCKQLIDRGAALTVFARFLYLAGESEVFQKMALKQKPLTEDEKKELKKEMNQIAGVLLGRAFLVEQRMPLQKRYEPLLHCIEFFDHNPQALIDQVKALKEDCMGTQPAG